MVYHNSECGNTGIIEEVNTYPYKGASKRQKSYRVIVKADYDNDFIYHISVFETLEEAKNDLGNICFSAMLTGSGGVSIAKSLNIDFIQEVVATAKTPLKQ